MRGTGGSAGTTADTARAARVRTPVATATRTADELRIDGRLEESAWAAAPVIDAFTQIDPVEGAPVTERTEVRIVYDDEAIYVGARLHDRGRVTRRLGRRDMDLAASDWLRVSFDSYHDRRTAFRFDINPSGVRRDAYLTGPDEPWLEPAALAWEAVWDAATTVDDDGWTAELRIPFSQLRFSAAEVQTWGLQLERIIERNQEKASFAFTPKAERGGIAAYGEIRGLAGLRTGRRLELLPYVLSRGEFVAPGDNPYRSEREFGASAGLDARYRATSDLTLSATLNPDFGQVEVDPAVVNLTAFETFYDEKRPFFVEGANAFDYAAASEGAGSAYANLFYSRRIGRAPQLRAPSSAADVPAVTTILGAAKLSGRTAGGWSLGVLDAVTQEETARFRDGSGEGSALAEPLTNYFVGRASRQMRQGQSALGAMVTATNRRLDGDARATASLREAAYTGGLDFQHEWAERTWQLTGFLAGSRVMGSAEAITATQRTPARYFQRPDADYLDVDPTATSLGGYAGQIQLFKTAGRLFTGDVAAHIVSPGYEINDLGFQSRSDRMGASATLAYHDQQPGNVLPQLRQVRIAGRIQAARNYGGDWFEQNAFLSLWGQHDEYWTAYIGGGLDLERPDDRLTRGGPLARRPASWRGELGMGTDARRMVRGGLNANFGRDAADAWDAGLSAWIGVRPSPRWSLSVGPGFERQGNVMQYVGVETDPSAVDTYGSRRIFAPLDYTELGIRTRLDVTFTPNLTLGIFAQPLVSRADFGAPREFRRAGAYEFSEYGTELGTRRDAEGGWMVDPDADGPAPEFFVADATSHVRSLRGSAVLRWEWRPGSTFYAVWQQSRWDDRSMEGMGIARATPTVFGARPDNVFVVKWSYWINPRT